MPKPRNRKKSVQEQVQITSDIKVTDDTIIDSIVKANIAYDKATLPFSSTARIPRVPAKVRERHDYMKYFVPMFVSIGPYHFGNQKLQVAEKLKPVFTMRLLSNCKRTLKILYNNLGEPEMVRELRRFYEKGSTTVYCDKLFTKMMLMDSCFILYVAEMKYDSDRVLSGIFSELDREQINLVWHDLLLLENQIPFKVLVEVMQLLKKRVYLEPFIRNSLLFPYAYNHIKMDTENDHLLHLLPRVLAKEVDRVTLPLNRNNTGRNFRNVRELVDVGIRFKPSFTKSLAHINFSKGWFGFSANVELPPITVNDSTKTKLLNLIAYEMQPHLIYDAWFTSYVCLIDSLIGQPEDVLSSGA